MNKQYNSNQSKNRIRTNWYIRTQEVRVILNDGSNGGIMNIQDAIKLAQNQNLDLIEINPKASPPVCKIESLGKFRYDEKKKQSQTNKNSSVSELKEITLRPTTDVNDLNHKLNTAKSFLANGDRVKFTVRFRGREMAHLGEGEERLQFFTSRLTATEWEAPPQDWTTYQRPNVNIIAGSILVEGRTMSVIIGTK